MPTIKGTASVSDSRARQKALRKTKFPRNYGKLVSVEKVNKAVLTQWIEQKITSILGFEDEIVSSTAVNLFLPADNKSPDPKKAQLDLTGVLVESALNITAPLHLNQTHCYCVFDILIRLSRRPGGYVF